MNKYPFINILKNPPKIDGKEYFQKVDIIKEVDEFQSFIEKNPIIFMNIIKDILKLLTNKRFFHISFTYNGEIDYLKFIIVLSPFEIIIDKDKKILLSPNSLMNILKFKKLQVMK